MGTPIESIMNNRSQVSGQTQMRCLFVESIMKTVAKFITLLRGNKIVG